MIAIALGGALLLAVADDAPKGADRAEYEARAAKAGRDAEAHVRLALWCEARGMEAERLKQLGLAVLLDPSHATARGLLGFVRDGARWLRPDAAADRARADEKLAATLADYEARRAKAPDEAEAQWKLALWCEQHGLKAEATAHLGRVVRLDPARDAAWKKLGFKKVRGRWATDEQLAAAKAEADAQAKADRRWTALLGRWKGWLATKGRRAEAEARLAEVTDVRAVPAILKVFAVGNDADQERAAQLLGQVDSPDASRALVSLAIFGASPRVRDVATATLRHRDRRDFLDLLIAQLRKPIQYEVRPMNGPGSPGAVFVEGERFNVERLYDLSPRFLDDIGIDARGRPALFGGVLRFEQFGTALQLDQAWAANNFIAAAGQAPATPVSAQDVRSILNHPDQAPSRLATDLGPNVALGMSDVFFIQQMAELRAQAVMAQVQQFAATVQRALAEDVATLDAYNKATRGSNARVVGILRDMTGADKGDDAESWKVWWADQLGYAYTPEKPRPKPTFTVDVPVVLDPVSGLTNRIEDWHHSCFAAGTEVWTRAGRRPIEDLKVGDLVLNQDPHTGALAYKPILAVFHNKPAPTLRIELGRDSDTAVVATPIHRFWVAGKGWKMARDLKSGDPIRVVGGTARVAAVTTERVQPVFNLEVADGRSFLVGPRGALVHDNSIVVPVAEPFDATGTRATAD